MHDSWRGFDSNLELIINLFSGIKLAFNSFQQFLSGLVSCSPTTFLILHTPIQVSLNQWETQRIFSSPSRRGGEEGRGQGRDKGGGGRGGEGGGEKVSWLNLQARPGGEIRYSLMAPCNWAFFRAEFFVRATTNRLAEICPARQRTI